MDQEFTLRQKQSMFARLICELIPFIFNEGYEVTLGDAFAKSGHCKNSNHYIRLAIDLNLFKDGKYLTDTESHKPFGEYWESLHPLCAWGGRFSNPDGNHYSLKHNGRA